MAWPSLSDLTPRAIRGITRLILSTLTIKCLFLSTRMLVFLTSESGIHELVNSFPIIQCHRCTLSPALNIPLATDSFLLGSHARTQYVSSILFLQFWFENLGRSRSHSWVPETYWWIYAYAARHEGWMSDGSRRWATVLGPSRAQWISVWSWLRGSNSQQFWTFQIQDSAESGQNASTKSSWENSRKRRNRNPVGVRNQGVSRPQLKCFKVFKWIGELESRTCSLLYSTFSPLDVSRHVFISASL